MRRRNDRILFVEAGVPKVELPLQNAFNEPTDFVLEITVDGENVNLAIAREFAGRSVDEDAPRSDLLEFAQVPGKKYEDLLGFILEASDDRIVGLIGVGSGNERFSVDRSQFLAALAD